MRFETASFENVPGMVAVWNRDGSKFALGQDRGRSLDVWDARSWKLERKLSVGFFNDENVHIEYKAIRFDCRGNIYCTQRVGRDGYAPTALQAKVWWPGSTKAEGIGSKDEPFDVAVACVDDHTRVVISYQPRNNPTPVDVLNIRQGPDGRRTVKRDYQVPELHWPRIALTEDGEYLLAQDEKTFRIYKLLPDHAVLIHSRDAILHNISKLAEVRPVVSSDGRLAAFCYGVRTADIHVVVVRIPDGEIIFDLPCKAIAFAFLPDSRLLAVGDLDSQAILVYAPESK